VAIEDFISQFQGLQDFRKNVDFIRGTTAPSLSLDLRGYFLEHELTDSHPEYPTRGQKPAATAAAEGSKTTTAAETLKYNVKPGRRIPWPKTSLFDGIDSVTGTRRETPFQSSKDIISEPINSSMVLTLIQDDNAWNTEYKLATGNQRQDINVGFIPRYMREATSSTENGKVPNFSLIMKWTDAGTRWTYTTLSRSTLNEDAQKLLGSGVDSFREKYGDHFVASFLSAKCVTAVWNFSSKTNGEPLKKVRDALVGEYPSDMPFHSALKLVRDAVKDASSDLVIRTSIYVSNAKHRGLIQLCDFDESDFLTAMEELKTAGPTEITHSVHATPYSATSVLSGVQTKRVSSQSTTASWMDAMKDVYQAYQTCASTIDANRADMMQRLDVIESEMLKIQTTIEQSEDAVDQVEPCKRLNKKTIKEIMRTAVKTAATVAGRKAVFDLWLAQSKKAEIDSIRNLE
jgi:hypothetical protein